LEGGEGAQPLGDFIPVLLKSHDDYTMGHIVQVSRKWLIAHAGNTIVQHCMRALLHWPRG
jgi:hypothetical protein